MRESSTQPEETNLGMASVRTIDDDRAEAHVSTTAKRHVIAFPPEDTEHLQQDEAYFFLEEDGMRLKVRFHDYNEIYLRPGLYEQIFYDRLKCESPARLSEWLARAVADAGEQVHTLRVLDLGAGNGIMAEALAEVGVARCVGVDILPEAQEAAVRDRPGVYDAYYVADLSKPSDELLESLDRWRFDCLTSVAALGFGDAPTAAFRRALGLIADDGWVCFNVKDTFLTEKSRSGFFDLVRELVFSPSFELHQMRRYRHRYSIDGKPLYYFGIVGRKLGPALIEPR